MTKEESWLLWMKESKHYVEYDWDTIKKSSHWQAFSRGWDAASVNANGWDDAYKMGLEAGKDIEKYTLNRHGEWQGLTDEEIKDILDCGRGGLVDIKKAEAKLKEKNGL